MREPSVMLCPRDRKLTVSWNHFILTLQVKQRRRYERRDPKGERSWADRKKIQFIGKEMNEGKKSKKGGGLLGRNSSLITCLALI